MWSGAAPAQSQSQHQNHPLSSFPSSSSISSTQSNQSSTYQNQWAQLSIQPNRSLTSTPTLTPSVSSNSLASMQGKHSHYFPPSSVQTTRTTAPQASFATHNPSNLTNLGRVKVAVRVRPPFKDEVENASNFYMALNVPPSPPVQDLQDSVVSQLNKVTLGKPNTSKQREVSFFLFFWGGLYGEKGRRCPRR